MRIAAVSDIHARDDGNDIPLIEAIVDCVQSLAPDVFVIAGDLNENIALLSEYLALLHIDGISNLFVAGNHDVWFEEEKGHSSLEKYSSLIGQACQDNGFIYLPDGPFVIGSVAFVGSIGWYDYSFKRPELGITKQTYSGKEYRSAVWRDYYNIDWSYSDEETTALFNDKLQYDLQTLPETVSSIVYVSHHLPFRDLTVYKDSLPWDFFSAFMGAESTGKMLLQDERVKLSICGHSHIRRNVSIKDITAISVPIGYGRPTDEHISRFAEKAVALVEILNDEVNILQFTEGDICDGLPYLF